MLNEPQYSEQKKQENRSRGQLCDRLAELGWVPAIPETDLGEDFVVSIYFEDHAPGVNFYVQLKSVTNLFERCKGTYLPYDFDVAHLEHWEQFATPVVLMVWDVKLGEGRWMLAKAASAELDQRRPEWRQNKTKARVHIPWENTTDDAGLSKLKASIGHEVYPLISRGRKLEIEANFAFPPTEEGQLAQAALRKFLEEGDPFAVKGRMIESLGFSDWWEPWFGGYDPDKVEILFAPNPSSDTHLVEVEIAGNNGEVACISNVGLRKVKGGSEVIYLSNEHQLTPIHFEFAFFNPARHSTCTVSAKLTGYECNMRQTLTVLLFQRAAASGGKLTLTEVDRGKSYSLTIAPDPDFAPDPHILRLAQKLYLIEQKTGQHLKWPEEGVPVAELPLIDNLIEVINNGEIASWCSTVKISAKAPDCISLLDELTLGKPLQIELPFDQSQFDILGVKIPTGPMIFTVKGTPQPLTDDAIQAITHLSADYEIALVFNNAEVIRTYQNWPRQEVDRQTSACE